MRWVLGLLAFAAFLAGCGGGGNNQTSVSNEILVGSSGNGKILRYDASTGNYLGVFAEGSPLVSPNGMGQLPSGDIVVGDFVTKQMLLYSPQGTLLGDLGTLDGTPYDLLPLDGGQFLVSVFDSAPKGKILRWTPGQGFVTFAEGGELDGPDGLVVRDGILYVSSQRSAKVLKYSLASGQYLGVFASGGGLGAPNAGPSGLVFGPGGDLYVTQHDTNPVATTNGMVLRFDGTTGAAKGTFIDTGSGGLSGPIGILATPAGHLLVTSAATNQVLEYDSTGAYVGVFASGTELSGPIYIVRRTVE